MVFRFTNGTATIALARATVAQDGTIATLALVHVTFPIGYANLAATTPNGGSWSTSVLIGERAEGPGAQPVVSNGSVDDLVAALAVLAVGLVIFVVAGARYLRR